MSVAGVTALVTRVSRRKEVQPYLEILSTRRADFENDVAMRVAAIEMAGQRQLVDDGLQAMFEKDSRAKFRADEVIVGSGWHGTEWAITRRALGYPAPIVLEERDYPGGCFSVCHRPGFRANSRNRPGPLGLPGQGRGLNVLPGALVQPSDLNTEEFQGNDVLAYCDRLALACNARVRPNAKVTRVGRTRNGEYEMRLEDGNYIMARRIIDARGLGSCTHPKGVKFDGNVVMDYNQFLTRLDQPFPFKDWGRVAVVGAGDGANTVIEALLGIGPAQLSNTQLDFVPEIDWYAPGNPVTKKGWSDTARCRYALIASYLPIDPPDAFDTLRGSRVEVIPDRGTVIRGPGGAFVNDRFYDAVILAIGFTPYASLLTGREATEYEPVTGFPVEGQRPSVLANKANRQEAWEIGTRAGIGFDSDEYQITTFPQNKVGIFRLIGRTSRAAALAGSISKDRPPSPTPRRRTSRPKRNDKAAAARAMRRATNSGTLGLASYRA